MRKLNGDHCQCSACGEYFNSTAAFDKHRRGDFNGRICLDRAQMLKKGMAVSSTGWWIGSKKAYSDMRSVARSGDLVLPYGGKG